MKKILLLLLVAFNSFADESIKIREDLFNNPSNTEYFILNDYFSKKTIFIPQKRADEFFMKSLNYYNRNLSIATKEAIKKASEEEKVMFVNIIAGDDIPAHTFKGGKPNYKVSEYTNGPWTIFKIDPKGRIVKDHYTPGEYGQVGRDGVSYEHAIRAFGGREVNEAIKRAKLNDEQYDWYITVKLPDKQSSFIQLDKFVEYEVWYNMNKLSTNYYTVEKIRRDRIEIEE